MIPSNMRTLILKVSQEDRSVFHSNVRLLTTKANKEAFHLPIQQKRQQWPIFFMSFSSHIDTALSLDPLQKNRKILISL